MIAIVVSRADSASEHIGEHLLESADWCAREDETRPDADGGGRYYRTPGFELRTFDELHIDLERPADAFDDPALLVFASRHSGDTGPLLTAHFTGNFGPAEFGGEPGELARTCPNAHAEVVAALEANAPDGYDVGVECTHHGPSDAGAPSMFVELGSGEDQWRDPDAARAVAASILALRDVPADRSRQLVGFGGGHYAPRFTRIVRETEWAVGHIAADWVLEDLGDPREGAAVLEQAFERSAADYAVIDDDRPTLAAVIDELGHRVVSERWVREVGTVPLDFVAAAEDAICTVDEGLRFGAPAESFRGEFAVASLPDDLLREAEGADATAAREAVAERALAFETRENGNVLAGRLAVESTAALADIVDALASVLREKYDAVEVHDRTVVARERAFDPEKARRLGVEEGPAFGTLASGDPVSVDGRTVDPDDVRTERTRRFEF